MIPAGGMSAKGPLLKSRPWRQRLTLNDRVLRPALVTVAKAKE
ncbi:MAG TPA: hypothetical protein VJB68_08930 [Methylophilaceae bacterium]|nr:hypothetical protein [Methylophilaceae bacterium]